jgi:hypothetical protein
MSSMQFVYSHHPENPERIRKYKTSYATGDKLVFINYYN